MTYTDRPGAGQRVNYARSSTPPLTEPLDFEQVPAELKALPQWVCWRLETRNGDPVKIPKSARTGRNASTTQPADWCDFETAVAAYQQDDVDGIGFVFTKKSGIVGIDLDECIDAETGELAAWAQEVVADLDSYTEVSPSGRGLHSYVVGAIHQSRKKGSHASSAIEIYDKGRYFTVTGRRFTERLQVEERQAALTRVYTRAFGNGTSSKPDPATRPATTLEITDAELLDKALVASNGSKFRDLWNGNTGAYGGDDSAADLALCFMLAFWTQKDAARMDRLFRQSGLMRPKWDSRCGETTYGQMTIDKAIAECSEVYTEGGKGNGHDHAPPADYSGYPEAIGASPGDGYGDHESQQREKGDASPPLPTIRFTFEDFITEPDPAPFLITGLFPLDVCFTNATGGTGKSTFELFRAIHIILGLPFLEKPIECPGPVLYVTAEDDPGRIKRRLYWIMEAMRLTPAQRRKVADNFIVADLCGSGLRLAALDRFGNITRTNFPERLVSQYREFAPVLVEFDPYIKFSPGEQHVNDGADAVINAMLFIGRELGCATHCLHHVSTFVFRDGIIDHHSGRGGSAIGDGARGVYSLVQVDKETPKLPGVSSVYQQALHAFRSAREAWLIQEVIG